MGRRMYKYWDAGLANTLLSAGSSLILAHNNNINGRLF